MLKFTLASALACEHTFHSSLQTPRFLFAYSDQGFLISANVASEGWLGLAFVENLTLLSFNETPVNPSGTATRNLNLELSSNTNIGFSFGVPTYAPSFTFR